jgi:hypothetical protein
MRKLLLVLLLFQSVIYAQDSDEIDANDELIIEESGFRTFNGSIFQKDDAIFLNASDCDFLNKEALKLNLNEKETKKWIKRIKKHDNLITDVKVVGTYNLDLLEVKKIKTPFIEPKKPSGAPNVDAYVFMVFEMYKQLKQATEEANYIKIVSKEENDPELGMVTSNTYYDSGCIELNGEQLILLKPKALSSTGKTLVFLMDLLNRQAELGLLSDAATAELEGLTGLTVLAATKNILNAKLVSAAVFVEIPKVISNVNKTKNILEQLKDE